MPIEARADAAELSAKADAAELSKFRRRFPLLASQTYMNSCSYGLLSDGVEAAFHAYLADRHSHGSPWRSWIGKYEALRQGFADLLGASAGEVAVTASASAGINSVATAVDFSGARDKVVFTDFEFPTNAQIWLAQAARGARIERVVADSPDSLLERLDAAIDERTRIVAVTHVCYRNGMKFDVGAITRLAQAKGALVLIDGFQAVGSMIVDVRALGMDFYVGGTLKYLLGTAGVGFLYARHDTTAGLQPTITGWLAQHDSNAMDHTRHVPSTDARRFEAGTPPIPNVYAASAGLYVLNSFGLAAAERQIARLTAEIVVQAQLRKLALVTPAAADQRGAMVAIRCLDAPALVEALAAREVIASSRDGNLRLSPHAYNSLEDVERVFAALDTHRLLLA